MAQMTEASRMPRLGGRALAALYLAVAFLPGSASSR